MKFVYNQEVGTMEEVTEKIMSSKGQEFQKMMKYTTILTVIGLAIKIIDWAIHGGIPFASVGYSMILELFGFDLVKDAYLMIP